jgi:hypothetical protein
LTDLYELFPQHPQIKIQKIYKKCGFNFEDALNMLFLENDKIDELMENKVSTEEKKRKKSDNG